MHALEVEGDLPNTCLEPNERPTIPAPRESAVRLKVATLPCSAAMVDIVVCDLSRDPRSEDFAPERVGSISTLWSPGGARDDSRLACLTELIALGLVG
ncbi:MAG: hypothetical protein BGO98_05705 [Myxococcales bacterium 68-20]|nr:hypothetical protein [Myxococcales bacterium]OJY28567.1 MAG: hypothetical protein BGO98_05705 [Myxococcales bacterium 68-20]